MTYSNYVAYLKDLLLTGIDNNVAKDPIPAADLPDKKKDIPEELLNYKLYTSMDNRFTTLYGVSTSGEDKKTADFDRSTVKAIAQNIFAYCVGSPFLTKPPTPGKYTLTNVLHLSQNPVQADSAPMILCGPMVRRVEPEAVTIWIALKESKSVTLVVYNAGSTTELFRVTAPTVQLGVFLHVVAITAKAPAGKSLLYGSTYEYDVLLDGAGLKATLGDAGLKKIVYGSHALPSFMLPPDDLNKVHIIHSSCRNIDSTSYDNMPGVDKLLEDEIAKGAAGIRPQQMFLSGDQIYADELNELLENLVIDTGSYFVTHLHHEAIPIADDDDKTFQPALITPGERGEMNKVKKEFTINNQSKSFLDIIQENGAINSTEYMDERNIPDYIHDVCGFTPTSRFHVLSLADFFSLYLLNWSDALWPPIYHQQGFKDWALKHSIAFKNNTDDSLFNKLEAGLSALKAMKNRYAKKLATLTDTAKKKACVELMYELGVLRQVAQNLKDLINLVLFASELTKTRRVFANISTYMIFDDHEITDDWHMTREWVHRAYHSAAGRRVMQNGLAAYAVFQAWGNTPVQFDDAAKPGKKLVDNLSSWITSNYTNSGIAEVGKIVKVPSYKEDATKIFTMTRGSVLPPADLFKEPLAWQFQVNHPKYEVLVTDTRTFRGFPGSLYSGADHLNDKVLAQQLPDPAPLPAPYGDKPKELTFVISSCNMLTVPLFRSILSTVALPLVHYLHDYGGNRWNMGTYSPDHFDSWEVGTKIFEQLLGRLAVRNAAKLPDDKKESRVVILSGDVHFSFAGRLAYWGDKPFNTGQTKAHNMVIAHLTASGMKNEASSWQDLKMDVLGYQVTDIGSGQAQLPEPEVMVGYPKAPDSFDAKRNEIVQGTRWFPNYRPNMILKQPMILPNHKIHPDIKIPKPDWMYRIDFIRGHKVTPVENINDFSHFSYAFTQQPFSEMIVRSNFASITMDWEGEASLAGEINPVTESLNINTSLGKEFPPAPFYVIIENEILFVTKVDKINSQQSKFTVKRGKADTVAAQHVAGKPVKIRRSVTQTSWMVVEPAATGTVLIAAPITRFKVALANDDLQYTKPTTNTQ